MKNAFEYEIQNVNFSCEDVRDIVIDIENNNKQNIIYSNKDQPIAMDVNSMYDAIYGSGVHKHVNYAVNHLLPFDYISDELISLLHRCLNHVYDHAYFMVTLKLQNGLG